VAYRFYVIIVIIFYFISGGGGVFNTQNTPPVTALYRIFIAPKRCNLQVTSDTQNDANNREDLRLYAFHLYLQRLTDNCVFDNL